MDRLRFATVGSVDDGKSTLIGRLLYDSKSIFEDQLEHIESVSKRWIIISGDSFLNGRARFSLFERAGTNFNERSFN